MRLRTCRLLLDLGLKAVPFDRMDDLLAALATGRQFQMLVLTLDGDTGNALKNGSFAVADTPMMLLFNQEPVEMVALVMESEHNDFMQSPFSNTELRDRLHSLYLRSGQETTLDRPPQPVSND